MCANKKLAHWQSFRHESLRGRMKTKKEIKNRGKRGINKEKEKKEKKKENRRRKKKKDIRIKEVKIEKERRE